jgi:hypothetical protein
VVLKGGAGGTEDGGRSSWRDEMRRLTEKGSPSIIYDEHGRSLWIFFCHYTCMPPQR